MVMRMHGYLVAHNLVKVSIYEIQLQVLGGNRKACRTTLELR